MKSRYRNSLVYDRSPHWNSFKRINFAIPASLFLLSLAGILMLYSVSGGEIGVLVKNHLVRICIGLLVFLAFTFTSIRIIRYISPALYLIILLCLLWLFFFETNTVSRWINLGSTSFQPAEVLKFVLILTLASYYSFLGERRSKGLFSAILPLVLIILPAFLTVRQPDLGTALLLLLAGISIIFFSGLRFRWIAIVALSFGASIPIILDNLKEYQKERLMVFLNPETDPFGAGYHIIQSKIAIGSGGFTGKGFMMGTQSQLNFLPEKHSDFMLSVLLEEMGFLGGLFVFFIFLYLILISIHTSLTSRSRFNCLACAGIAVLTFLYFFINSAMIMGIIPIVGVPLPMLSYGGSAIIAFCAAMGFVVNARINRDIKLESFLGN